jgi:hypothetical protein
MRYMFTITHCVMNVKGCQQIVPLSSIFDPLSSASDSLFYGIIG